MVFGAAAAATTRLHKIAWLGLLAPIGYGLMLTQSRAGMFAGIVVGFVFALRWARRPSLRPRRRLRARRAVHDVAQEPLADAHRRGDGLRRGRLGARPLRRLAHRREHGQRSPVHRRRRRRLHDRLARVRARRRRRSALRAQHLRAADVGAGLPGAPPVPGRHRRRGARHQARGQGRKRAAAAHPRRAERHPRLRHLQRLRRHRLDLAGLPLDRPRLRHSPPRRAAAPSSPTRSTSCAPTTTRPCLPCRRSPVGGSAHVRHLRLRRLQR